MKWTCVGVPNECIHTSMSNDISNIYTASVPFLLALANWTIIGFPFLVIIFCIFVFVFFLFFSCESKIRQLCCFACGAIRRTFPIYLEEVYSRINFDPKVNTEREFVKFYWSIFHWLLTVRWIRKRLKLNHVQCQWRILWRERPNLTMSPGC